MDYLKDDEDIENQEQGENLNFNYYSNHNSNSRKSEKMYSFEVDISQLSPEIKILKEWFSSKIIGQERAINHIIRAFQKSRFRNKNLPLAVFLFAGPTGVGKTETAKEIARYYIADTEKAPLIHIGCSNLSEKHNVASLIGAPPGYKGCDEPPLLSNINLITHFIRGKNKTNERFARDFMEFENKMKSIALSFRKEIGNDKIQEIINLENKTRSEFWQKWGPVKSVILFDELEKAHESSWQILLDILGEGKITLNTINQEEVFFNHSIIIMTTNLGSQEVQKIASRESIGFKAKNSKDGEKLDLEIYKTVKRAIEKRLSPELIGRLKENLIVFRHFENDDYIKLVDLHIFNIIRRFSDMQFPLVMDFSKEFKKMLIEKGIDRKYGARVLSQKIEKYVVEKIAVGIETNQIRRNDSLLFCMRNNKPVLLKK